MKKIINTIFGEVQTMVSKMNHEELKVLSDYTGSSDAETIVRLLRAFMSSRHSKTCDIGRIQAQL